MHLAGDAGRPQALPLQLKIQVRVIPKAKRPGVETVADGSLKVRVAAPAEGGRANAAVIEALAQHFGVPKRAVTIVRGQTSRTKWAAIDTGG